MSLFSTLLQGQRLLCTVMLVFLVSTTLAGYKSIKVKVDPAKTYPFHQSQGNVTIAVDPYESDEKIKTAFDVKGMEKLGIIPVNIIITNEGEDPISVSGQDVNLLDVKNQSIESTPLEEVVRLILNKGKEPSASGRSRSPIPLPRRDSQRGDTFEIQTDFTNKALKEARVAPKSTASGFVFFRLPSKQMKLSGYKIYIPEIKNLKIQQNLLFFEIEIK
jgi:hypothetical protein